MKGGKRKKINKERKEQELRKEGTERWREERGRQTDRQAGRQTGRQDRQAGRIGMLAGIETKMAVPCILP